MWAMWDGHGPFFGVTSVDLWLVVAATRHQTSWFGFPKGQNQHVAFEELLKNYTSHFLKTTPVGGSPPIYLRVQDGRRWRSRFSASFVEEITRKTGNAKKSGDSEEVERKTATLCLFKFGFKH